MFISMKNIFIFLNVFTEFIRLFSFAESFSKTSVETLIDDKTVIKLVMYSPKYSSNGKI